MKRIAFIVCGILLLVANTAEARRGRNYSQPTYSQPVVAQPVHTAQKPVLPATSPAPAAKAVKVTPAAQTTPTKTVAATTTTAKKVTSAFDTSTAQGVANIMASRNMVGHFGGNPGYEGCGMGATKQAAYSICCYGNSGMATVDVGYAQAANGMWYCCRRYR